MWKITTRAKNPCFTEEVHDHKKVLQRREKIYRNTKLLKHGKHTKKLRSHTRLSYNKPKYKHYPPVSMIVAMMP